MKRSILPTIATFAVMLSASLTFAQDMGDSIQMQNDGPMPVVDPDGGLLECCCCPVGGWEGGIELTYFDVRSNHGTSSTGNSWFDGFDNTGDLRYWAGYQGENGLGARVRYWNYDGDDNSIPGDVANIEYFDIEGTGGFCVCEWDFLATAGIRWMDLDFSGDDQGAVFGFDGFGTILGMEARRPVTCNLAFVAGIRYSSSYGETSQGANVSSAVVHGTETRLGLEWSRARCNGGYLVARAMWEQQVYEGLSENAVSGGIDPEDLDLTFAGPVFSIGIER